MNLVGSTTGSLAPHASQQPSAIRFVGHDENPRSFSRCERSPIGPLRQILKRKRMSAFRVIAEVAATCFKRRE